ncbi:MAG TPA: cell wall hydrolase [Parvularculaceae bacterium]|nr:cell wall hydrolase [Parvularculaceae bacterium]
MTGHPVHNGADRAGDRRLLGDVHWPEVSWTVRSLLAAAGVAVCIMMTAMSATASVKRNAAERAAALEVADEAQLVAEYAHYLTEQTAQARAVLSSPRLKPAVTPAMMAAEGAPISDLVDFDFTNLELARLDEEERTCLAQAIYYEARSERRVGQLAVADVVLNRVASPVYPDTICEVVFQGSERKNLGCQFSFTCDGSMKARLNERKWREAEMLAGAVLAGIRKPVSRYATHYHADYVSPPWADTLTPTAVIGTHKFYRFPNRAIVAAAPAAM